MAVEAASKISDFNAAWPLFDDPIVEGDDHIRLLKSVVKLDAVSKAETAAQTVVSPLTLNGLVTGMVGFRAESALPYFELRENDVSLPGGLFRLQSSAGALTLRANTAPAGDFSTGVNIINYAAGILNFEAPVAFDVLKVESTTPRVEFVESDQAAPAGRYRLTGSGDAFILQRALTGEFTTVENLFSYAPATGFTFSKTVAAPMRVGSLYIGGQPTGTVSATTISTVTGSPLVLRSGIDTSAAIQFTNASNAIMARIDPAGTATVTDQTVITQEKGDARYVELDGTNVMTGGLTTANISMVVPSALTITMQDTSGGTNQKTARIVQASTYFEIAARTDANAALGPTLRLTRTAAGFTDISFNGTAAVGTYTLLNATQADARYLNLTAGSTNALTGELFTKSGVGIRLKSAVGATGYGTLFYSDATSFHIMLTANNDADGTFNGLRPFAITKATGHVTMSENLTVGGFARSADIYVGANPAGVVSPPTVSAATGSQLRLRGGLATGSIVTIRDSADAVLGTFGPAGTALVDTNSVITGQKGDFRYAAASSQRFKDAIVPQPQAALLNAFDTLSPSAWTWGGETPENDERYGTTGVGFIAEDVEPVFPAAVRYQWVPAGNDENGEPLLMTEKQVLGLDPMAMLAVLWEKVREQETRLAALEAA